MYLEIENEKEINQENAEESQSPEEEKQVTEVPVEEESKESPIDLKAPNEKPYEDIVEELRVRIFAAAKKSQMRSRVTSAIMLIFLLAAVVMLFINNEEYKTLFTVLGIVFLVLAVVTLLTGSLINKRIDRIDTKNDYVIPAMTAINRHVFSDERIIKASIDFEERIDLGKVFEDGVYVGATDSVSRNISHINYKGQEMLVGELGIYTGPRGKQRKTAFIGKYISTDNKLHFENRYLIISKAQTPIDVPEIPHDLVLLHEDGSFSIYGSEKAKFKEDLGTEFISNLKKIEVKDMLLNMSIGISAGQTSIYLSFDDPVTTLPFYEKLNPVGIEQSRAVLYQVLEDLELLSK